MAAQRSLMEKNKASIIDTTSEAVPTLRIGTRSSALALAQVDLFTSLLSSAQPTQTIALSTNLGDTNKTTDLHTLASAGKSLWTEDLETELLANRVDCIIHSLKDVPTKLPVGCVVRAIGRREESRDCLLLAPHHRSKTLQGAKVTISSILPPDAVIGTSSVRRAALLRRLHPQIRIKDIRGNVPTRIRKLDDPAAGFDAIVLAGAGVQRLGMSDRIDIWLGRDEGFPHAVGQGALGIEWREGDQRIERLLDEIELRGGNATRRVRWEGTTERALLRVLEGGCSVPVGINCVWNDAESTILSIHASVTAIDGTKHVTASHSSPVSDDHSAEAAGLTTAQILIENGAQDILKDIGLNRKKIEGQGNA